MCRYAFFKQFALARIIVINIISKSIEFLSTWHTENLISSILSISMDKVDTRVVGIK